MNNPLKGKLIKVLLWRVQDLEIEIALLKKSTNRKTIKNKWGKVPHRKRHLKLISLNGAPIHNKD